MMRDMFFLVHKSNTHKIENRMTTVSSSTNHMNDYQSNSSFTYPNWEEDAKEVHDDFMKYDEKLAEICLRGMRNKQLIYEGRCDDPHIQRLYSGEFCYDGFDDHDKYSVLFTFGKGLCIDEIMKFVELKQMTLYHGDRSHPIIQTIDTAKFDYDGWENDLENIKSDLFGPMSLFPSFSKIEDDIDMMFTKQQRQFTFYDDPSLQVLHDDSLTYSNAESDKMQVFQLYRDGRDVDELIEFMEARQRLHDGKSHPILKKLDSSSFTYKNWKKDAKAIRNKLLYGQIAYHNDWSVEEGAELLMRAMENKERIYNGKDHLMQSIASGLFTYNGFEDDKDSIVKRYKKGIDVDDEFQSMIKKQKHHVGLYNSHPILSVVNNALRDNHELNENIVYTQRCRRSDNENDGNGDIQYCVVCMENQKEYAFVPCGHVCLCDTCVKSPEFSSRLEDKRCPICRKQSEMLMKVYT